MTYAVTENIARHADQEADSTLFGTPTGLYSILFGAWIKKDTNAAQAWLLAHWDDPALLEKSRLISLRNRFSMDVTEKQFIAPGSAAAAAFVHSIPASADRREALKALTGMSAKHHFWEYSGQPKRLALYNLLKQFADEPWQRELMQHHLETWATRFPDGLRQAIDAATPADHFQLSLGFLGARSQWGPVTTDASGRSSMRPSPITDRPAREAATLQAGLAAGMAREQILPIIIPVMIDAMEKPEALAWFDANRGQLPLDDILVKKVRRVVFETHTYRDNDPPEAVAIAWAERIADPGLRLKISRAAFRRLITLTHPPDAAASFLTRQDIAPDLRAEFTTLLNAAK